MPEPIKSANPTPKQDFLSSGSNISAHRKLIEMPEFQRALDFAKLHYARFLNDTSPRDLNAPNYMSASAVCFHRLQGMHDFIDVLLRLGDTPQMPSKQQTGNLEHNN